jgi:hypothetical protein
MAKFESSVDEDARLKDRDSVPALVVHTETRRKPGVLPRS